MEKFKEAQDLIVLGFFYAFKHCNLLQILRNSPALAGKLWGEILRNRTFNNAFLSKGHFLQLFFHNGSYLWA